MAFWRYLSLSKINKNMIRQITERKRAEAFYQESEARYRALFEGSPDAIFFADPETGIILGANPAASRLLARSHGNLIGLHQSKLHPSRKEAYARGVFIRHVEDAREQKGLHPSEMTVLRPDGSEVPVEVLAQLVDIGGKKVLQGVFRDITERKKAEEALQKREEQLSESQRIAQIGSWERDIATNRVAGSNELYRILGLDPLTMAVYPFKSYQAILDIIHPDDRERFVAAGREAVHGNSPYGIEFRIIRKDGSVATVYSRGEVVHDEAGNPALLRGTLQDITERKKLEAQLLQAQKMEAVGQLAGGIAHDFNNILTAIIGYSSMVLMKMTKDDPLRQKLDNILASAGRAANLTQNLLAFSRKQIMQAKPVNLNDIIKNINNLLSRIIGEDIELRMNLAAEELTIQADRGQLEQVLMNLATNARDAMPTGGRLSLQTSRVTVDRKLKGMYGHGKPGEYALLSISDTGEGMDGATQAKAFEPFFTTKEVNKGTGLGLSIVYGIIKQHDGYITVDSELGRGTTFKIHLPLISSDRKDVKSEELIFSKGGTETILLAEDEESIRELMSEELMSAGYAVIVANDGEDAIQKFTKNADKIHLLMDVIMPKKSGKEAYEAIKQMKSSIKALFLSGYSADIIQKKGLLDTGLNFVYKPITPTGLLQKVREVLDEHISCS
jgi:PAS domain S-box-containing protein